MFLTSVLRQIKSYSVSPGLPPSDPRLGTWMGSVETASGVQVTEWTALNYSAVYAAVNIISGSLAMLPLILYQRLKSGKTPAVGHDVYHLLRYHPCPEMTPVTWTQTLTAHVLTWGMGYAAIERNVAGRPVALWPVAPHRVVVDRDRDRGGRVIYRVSNASGLADVLDGDDMLAIPGLGYDGVVGYPVVRYARDSLGLGMATERHGATLFGNGARPGGILKSPSKLKRETRDELRESWERIHQGPNNANRVAVLDGGLEWQAVGIPPEDAQFLETRQFQIVEVARWFNLPPHLLRDLSRATFANIEHQSLEFVTYTLGPWMSRWEQEIIRKLLTPDEREEYFAEFCTKPLLRGDAVSRWNVHQIARQNGIMNADEIRAAEGMNPAEDGTGQVYLVNGAMVPVELAGQQGLTPAENVGESETPAATMPAALLEVPDIRQTTHYTCGACATAAVCAYFGAEPSTEAAAVEELGTTQETSTYPHEIIRVLTDVAGLKVTVAHDMTVEDLERFWRLGQPVICCIQDYNYEQQDPSLEWSGHYVVVIGVALGYVFIQDSSMDNALAGSASEEAPGRGMIRVERWDAIWHDKDADGIEFVRYGIAVAAELPDDQGDEEPGESGTEEKPSRLASSPPASRSAALHALRGMVAAVLGKTIRKECAAVRRAAKVPAKFLTWAESFYETVEPQLAEDMVPAARLTVTLASGTPATEREAQAMAEAVARAHVVASRDQLLEVAGSVTAKDLERAVNDLCERWESGRAAASAAELVRIPEVLE